MDPLGHLIITSKHKHVVSYTAEIADAVQRYLNVQNDRMPFCPI